MFVYICMVVRDSIIMRDENPINRFNPATPHLCLHIQRQDLHFQLYISWWVLCRKSELKGGCSPGWYLWNCCPSLFKHSFHNYCTVVYVWTFMNSPSFKMIFSKIINKYGKITFKKYVFIMENLPDPRIEIQMPNEIAIVFIIPNSALINW